MTTATRLLTAVCAELEIPCRSIDEAGVVLELTINGQPHWITNNNLGLISDAEAVLCEDKAFQAQVLAETKLMPLTRSYIDPNSPHAVPTLPTLAAIAADIQQHLAFPIIVKKNTGSQGEHVFKVTSVGEVERALQQIFNFQHAAYDHVAVVQPYVTVRQEYRAVIFQGQIALVYSKVTTPETKSFTSASRWEQGNAKLVTDPTLLKRLQQLATSLYQRWPIRYAGLDVVLDDAGRLWLLELNAAPAFAMVVRDEGAEPAKILYRQILNHLQQTK